MTINDIVCPYCGKRHQWDKKTVPIPGNSFDVPCSYCKKVFVVSANLAFSTRKKEE